MSLPKHGLGLTFLSLIISSAANAGSLTITGTVVTQEPSANFEIDHPTSYRAFVESFSHSVAHNTDGCQVTESEADARRDMTDGSIKCLFRYVNLPDGLTFNQSTLRLEGILPNVGDNSIGYEYVYFNGSNKTPIIFNAGTQIFEGKEPVTPAWVGVNSKWSDSNIKRLGPEPINYDRKDLFQSVTPIVEYRDYPQKVVFRERGYIEESDFIGQCIVEVGFNFCTIDLPDKYVGLGQTNISGFDEYVLDVNSTNDYFNSSLQEFTIRWDYRPPIVTDQQYKAVVNDGNLEVVIGESIAVPNNSFMVEIQSPHDDHEDESKGHQVAHVSLTLIPNEGNSRTSPLYDGDDMLFQDPALGGDEELKTVELDPVGIEKRNGKYYAEFSLMGIPNGVYETSIVVGDENGNDTESEQGITTSLTRTYPSIRAFSNNERIRSGHDVYFMEHLSFATHNGYPEQSNIATIHVNGELVYDYSYTGTNEKGHGFEQGPLPEGPISQPIVYLHEHLETGFPRNSEVRVEVSAYDNSGMSVDEVFVFNYMPMSYQYSNAPDEVYQGIQMLEIGLEQNSGTKCAIFSDETLAIEAAAFGRFTCLFEWEVLPYGIEPNLDSYSPEAIGTIDLEGDFTIQASMYMFDSNGNKALAWEGSKTMTSLPIEVPEIILDEENMVNGAYPMYVEGGKVVTAEINAVNSQVEIELYDPTKEIAERVELKQRKLGESKLSTNYVVESEQGTLWSTRTYNMSAKYVLEPDQKTSKEIDTFFVPSRKIKARLEMFDKQAISTINMDAKISVGKYNSRERKNEYDALTMGQWDVAIVTEDEEGNQIPVSIWSPVDANGEARLTVDLDKAVDSSLNIYGVAKLRSQIEGYERTLETQDYSYRIIKGREIEGGLKYRTVTAIPPFSASFRHVTETRDDLSSRGNITWEVSADNGSTWGIAQEPSRSASFVYRVEEGQVGEWLVRARVKNTYTDAESITESVKITSYNRPRVRIQAPSQALVGQNVEFVATDENKLLTESDVYEWSLDKGATWNEGEKTFTINDIQDSVHVYTRAQYASVGENAKEVAWAISKHRLTVREPKEPRLSARIPRLMEVGYAYRLEAIGRKPFNGMTQEILYEWEFPDGTIKYEPIIDFTPIESDVVDRKVNIKLRAWIEGYKVATMKEKELNIRTWKYEFPEHELKVVQRQLFAPSEVMMVIRKPRIYAPGVQFEYNFSYDTEAIEFVYAVGDRTKIKLLTPGIHQIDVSVTDNRGNIQEITHFLEALELEPIEVESRETFSNQYDREPLDVSMRISTTLSHPKDRIVDYKWFLNDEQLSEDGSRQYRWIYENLGVGTHTLVGQIITDFGQVGEFTKVIEVKENEPPTCTHSLTEYTSYARITLSCNDTDGKIQTYKWFVNGEEVGAWSRSIALSYEDEDITVTGEAYDDSGEKAVISDITIYARD